MIKGCLLINKKIIARNLFPGIHIPDKRVKTTNF